MVLHSVAIRSPTNGTLCNQDGGAGNAIDSSDWSSAVRPCALLTMVARASVTGTKTMRRIVAVTIATARPRRWPSAASSLSMNGHVATLIIDAHRMGIRNGLSTQKVEVMSNKSTMTDRVVCVMSAVGRSVSLTMVAE